MIKDLFLHSFCPILPSHHLPQNVLVDWILKAHEKSMEVSGEGPEERFSRIWKKFCLHENYIRERYFECHDVDLNWEDHAVYHLTPDHPFGASMGERGQFFSEKTARVFEELYKSRMPHHLIHVTCTGYVSPSPAQLYFSKFSSCPEITHAYHMGCYASLPAIRMAMGTCLLIEKNVDVVHTELCSLHMNPHVHTPEQFVVQTLFADGFIKYEVSQEQKGLKIISIHERIVPDSHADMTWIPESFGMKMGLSREVPAKIGEFLPLFLDELCEKAEESRTDLLKNAIFAVHPGGPKIIDSVKQKLELNEWQVEHSRKVLFERGNMSSATLPHVWDEILSSGKFSGKKVVSLAFGPGLTVFGSVFEVV